MLAMRKLIILYHKMSMIRISKIRLDLIIKKVLLENTLVQYVLYVK